MATAALAPICLTVHEDGTLEARVPWPAVTLFSDAVLGAADGRRLVVGGGEAEVRCTNGGAVYALARVPALGVAVGTFVRETPPC